MLRVAGFHVTGICCDDRLRLWPFLRHLACLSASEVHHNAPSFLPLPGRVEWAFDWAVFASAVQG